MHATDPNGSPQAEPHPIYWPCRLATAGGGYLLVIRNLRPTLEAILGLDQASLNGAEPVAVCAAFLTAVSWPIALPQPLGPTAEGTVAKEADHDY